MALLLLIALAAFKIDGWLSTLLLILAMIVSSPVVVLPKKSFKWLLVGILFVLALWQFPDIERYREAFEEQLETQPLPVEPGNEKNKEDSSH